MLIDADRCCVGILKIKLEAVKKKIQESVIVKVQHLVESSTPGQNLNYFRHVEEVVSCGQFGDPLGQHQAAGINLKANLELCIANR